MKGTSKGSGGPQEPIILQVLGTMFLNHVEGWSPEEGLPNRSSISRSVEAPERCC